MIQNQSKLETAIKYQFKDAGKLEEALTHPSITQKHDIKTHKNYERFEILGDALLGFLITEMLFHQFPKCNEGHIAKYKSHLVSKTTLCNVAKDIKLQNYILMSKGEENDGGRENVNNMENALEALICAIFLDSHDIETIKKIIHNLWSKYVTNINLKHIDPKTCLQEWSQANNYGLPIYEVVSRAGAMHTPTFTVRVRVGSHTAQGRDNAIKKAEKKAAMMLINQIDN